MLNAYEQINDDNMNHYYVCNSFGLFGLNPFEKDDSKFVAHLDSLSLTSEYNASIETHRVETLELKIQEL
jgi:hypothetical protein